jgi:hypothetical protein
MRLSFRLAVMMVGCGVWVGAAGVSAKPALTSEMPEGQAIFGGQPVEACAWPSVVAVSNKGSLCTGTLVHPRVVMFAAHCGAGNPKILFGEDVSTPIKTIPTELCMTNPDYSGVTDQAHDWAFCRLPAPITDIPITPIVYGCETEAVSKGASVVITGYGIQQQNGDAGLKNWAETVIDNVYSMKVEVGGLGNPGICPGDSGGPAFVRYPDGSWHVFGIASTLTGDCGGLGTHSLAWHAVPWIEAESGIDITPCHDQDGTWNPDFRCAGFYSAEPGEGFGQYGNWCPGTPRNGPSATCGAGFDSVPDDLPPTVKISVPIAGEHPDLDVFATPIEIDAQDGDGWGVKVVRIKINGEEQAMTDDLPPYQFPAVNFPKGTWELVAIAEDGAGLITESEPVVVQVGMVTPPDDTGSTPTTGEATSGGETGAVETTPTSSASMTGTAGESGDTVDTAGTNTGDDGCGCRSRTGAPAAWWLLILPVLCRRRRDSRVA